MNKSNVTITADQVEFAQSIRLGHKARKKTEGRNHYSQKERADISEARLWNELEQQLRNQPGYTRWDRDKLRDAIRPYNMNTK